MKKKKLRLNKRGKILVGFVYTLVFILISCSIFGFITRPVSKNKEAKLIIIENGDTYTSISSVLKDSKLIRSELGYKLYIKLNRPKKSLKAGKHYLKENMTLRQLVKDLGESPANADVLTLTFKEGVNMRGIASIIDKNTSYKADDLYKLLKDNNYLDELIKKYWFLTDEIKNTNIYYSLEGYLYPNTYEFNKDAKLEEILEKMLDETDKQLSKYKDKIGKSKYTFHQIMTLASMCELEAVSAKDRQLVASVFYNRLASNMSLGSDVTTYYAAKVDMGQRDLYQAEIESDNPYNTRSASMIGKIPVGPICNPSIDAIDGVINKKQSDYLYFVADKNKKVYFTKTESEHNAIIKKLQDEGLWYTYN